MPLREREQCGQEAEGECARCGASFCRSCVYHMGDDAVCDQCMSNAEYATWLEEN